ncbi:MAG: leucine-rich repeat protein [Oscillospiraceae bacterium]|nr:leucine-rich repeat protein [Oscillospiraceae bacterium]
MRHSRKRLIGVLLAVAVLAGLFAVTAIAAPRTFEYDSLEYTILSESDKTVAAYRCLDMGDGSPPVSNVVIPEQVTYGGETYTVIQIAKFAFSGNSVLESVTIPKTVTYIRDRAFENCPNLTTITFASGSTLREIGRAAFAYTKKDGSVPKTIENLTLPASLEAMADGAFQCRPVKHFALEDGSLLEAIPNGFLAADGADAKPGVDTKTTSAIDYINNVLVFFTSEPYPFTPEPLAQACSCLESIDLGASNSLVRIGDGAFKNQGHLTAINFGNPMNELTIGSGAFVGAGNNAYFVDKEIDTKLCDGIATLVFPANLKQMNYGCFYLSRVKNVVFSDNCKLETICASFMVINGNDGRPSPAAVDLAANCLESVKFGNNNSLKYISGGSFKNQSHLTEIDFGTTVNELTIGAGAFLGVGNNAYLVEKGIDTSLNDGIDTLVFPANLTMLDNGCFYLSRVKKVVFSDNCKLETIGNSFMVINGDDGRPSLAAVDLAANCLESVKFGANNSLKRIGEASFKNQSHMTEIDFGATANDLTIGSGAFLGVGNNALLVENGIDSDLNDGIDTVVFPANLTTLSSGCFRLARVKNIVFSDNCKLETINTGFMVVEGDDGKPSLAAVNLAANCLESVKFGANNSLKTIKDGTFRNQSHLTEIDFGTPVNDLSISYAAFLAAGNNGYLVENGIDSALNDGIDTLIMPENLTTLSNGAFRLARVKNLVFSDNCKLEKINSSFLVVDGEDGKPAAGYESFASAVNAANCLESVKFGANNSLKIINSGSFKNQSHLTEIDFGTPVNDLTIDYGVFIGAGNNAYLVEKGIDESRSAGIGTLVLPVSMTQLNSGCFRYLQAEKIVCEEGCQLTELDGGVFSNNDELTTVDLRGSRIVKIDDALENNPKLTCVYFPETLESVVRETILSYGIKESVYPFYGCGAVNELHFATNNSDGYSFADNVFEFLSDAGIVYVPADTTDGAIDDYVTKLTAAGLVFGENNWKIERERDPGALDSVAFTVTEPKIGETPCDAVTVITDPADALTGDTVGVRWEENTTDDYLSSGPMTSETFEEGKYYFAFASDPFLETILVPGYSVDDKTNVTVNGEEVSDHSRPYFAVFGPLSADSSTCIVTFDVNGHGTAPDAQEVEVNGTASEPARPSADGYIFLGWYTEPSCKTKYDFSTPVTGDITLYARWLMNTDPAPYVPPVVPESEAPFVDVPDTAYYADSVQWAWENDIVSGTDLLHFSPDGIVSRAQMVTFLWRAAGRPAPISKTSPFDDVTENRYYYEAVLWAAENGITAGTGNGKFSPDDPVTRAQVAAFLYRYEQANGGGFKGLWFFPLDYADANDVPNYAYEAFCYLTKEGIIYGTGGKLLPNDPCLRSQIVAILHRFFAD